MGENGVEGRVVEIGEEGSGPMRVMEAPGPTAELSGKRPVEVFEELLTPNIVTGILEQTNRYGQQYVDGPGHILMHTPEHVHMTS